MTKHGYIVLTKLTVNTFFFFFFGKAGCFLIGFSFDCLIMYLSEILWFSFRLSHCVPFGNSLDFQEIKASRESIQSEKQTIPIGRTLR